MFFVLPTNALVVIAKPMFFKVGGSLLNQRTATGAKVNSMLYAPHFTNSFFAIDIEAANFCLGNATEFSTNVTDPITSILWDFGDGNTSNLVNPEHRYSNPGDYMVSVTVNTVAETITETKVITIFDVVFAFPIPNYEVCIEDDATFTFDLTSRDAELLGTQSAAEFQVSYHPNSTAATLNINQLSYAYSNTLPTETIFARISNRNNPSCYATRSFDLVVIQTPLENTVEDWVVCDTDMDGFNTFNLNEKTIQILENNDVTNFNVTYYLNQTTLNNRTDALALNFTNTSPKTEIFWRIENNSYPNCYGEGTFFLEVIAGVTASIPSDFEVCDDNNDGIYTFDLRTKEAEILGAQNATSSIITFHKLLADAESGNAPVNKNNYSNTTPYSETLFIRIANNTDASCYDTSSLALKVSDTPIQPSVTNWLVCDDDFDGIHSFDLTKKNTEILGSQASTNYNINYYKFLEDANVGENEITSEFSNANNPQTIFYRIENNNNSYCYSVGNFELEVINSPMASMPTAVMICDTDESGIYNFDLSQKDADILNGQDTDNFEVLYYSTEADATNNQDPLSKTRYSNSKSEETIYARVQNSKLNTCFAITNFQISIRPLPQPMLEPQYVICPDRPDLSIDGGDFETWVWYDSKGEEISTSRLLNVSNLGDYSLTVSNSSSGLTCEKTVSFEVLSSGAPEDFSTSLSGFSDVITITVNVDGTGDFEYAIEDEDYQDSNQLIVFPGKHTVYVRDKYLCRTISKEVFALGYQKFFTPNNDNIHDTWHISGPETNSNTQLFIFDRYGKLLTQLMANGKGWDGTIQGVQMPESDYWFRFVDEDGVMHTGHFSLKR